MNNHFVTVEKNGQLIQINEGEISEGDMVVIQTGEIVPADIQLVRAKGLEVDEFEITGELLPVVKSTKSDQDYVYRGSQVVKGWGTGKVLAVGEKSEFGRIIGLRSNRQSFGKINLVKKKYFWLILFLLPSLWGGQAGYFGRIHNFLVFLAASALLLLLQNNDILKYVVVRWAAFRYKKSMGYSIAPELFLSINDLDYLCFDKTGVLTSREIRVKDLYFPEDNSVITELGGENYLYSSVKKALVLCNDVFHVNKFESANAIDRALFRFAQENSVNAAEIFASHKRVLDQPFDSEKRWMSAGFKSDNGMYHMFIKGDPEVIFPKCSHFLSKNGGWKNIDSSRKSNINSELKNIFRNGNAALAIAYSNEKPENKNQKFALLCIVEFHSPLHPASPSIIKEIQNEKKRVLLLTGDRHESALSVAKEVGLISNPNEFLTGKMIAKMSLNEISKQSNDCSVFARLTPSQKGVLIRVFQQQGHKVLMVGDGANDGIALKVADLGISFLRNSSPVAKRIADVLIRDLGELKRLLTTAKNTTSLLRLLKILRAGIIVWLFVSAYHFAL